MINQVEKISQHVDTLKLHYYLSKTISDESFTKFNEIIDKAIKLKKEAQLAKNEYGDTKLIKLPFGTYFDYKAMDYKHEHYFNVMATSINGFSVVIFNNDVSIALRKSKNKVNTSPLVKLEFRAEFLARNGYKRCLKIVNDFVKKYLIDDYMIKISEIHLATDIQNYDFSPLDFYRVKTRSRNKVTHEEETDYSRASSYGGITSFSGFSFGGGDYHFRVYNKTLEINKFKNKGFVKPLLWENKPNYNPDSKVWRLEIQIRRAKLKKMVNSENSTMDDYENILNDIPSLWSKALSDFEIRNFSDKQAFEMLCRYKTLKNGERKYLSKNAIYSIFKRSDPISFWSHLSFWNGHNFSFIGRAFDVPKSGSFDYVSNSIKSLYSTIGKHYGSVSAKTLIDAFKQANDINIEKKQMSLIEDSFHKQIDWFERIDFLKDNGVLSVPLYKDLEREIYHTVVDCNNLVHDSGFTYDIVDRIESRMNLASKNEDLIIPRDISYLNNLIDKIEAKNAF